MVRLAAAVKRVTRSVGGQRPPADGGKTLILVVGVGRSGTSAFTSVMAHLGFVVPQPEVRPKSSNPRGFGEPRWAVQFHRQLLEDQHVRITDERPRAWRLMREATD